MSRTIESRERRDNSNNLLSQRLAIRVGSDFNLTQKGILAHELVAVSEMLRNHQDPRVAFSLSDDLCGKLSLRQEQLSATVGLESDEHARERKIRKYKARLEEVGYPYWRKLNDGK